MPRAYWDYLHLDQLLALQGGFEGDEDALLSDELHFIIVHQSYELWFKLVIRSLRLARDHLAAPRVAEETIPHVAHHLRRVTAILGLLVEQFSVVETLTPLDFLDFREKLVPSSGFQSHQMRVIEVLMGLEDSQRVAYGKVSPLKHIQENADASPAGRLAWSSIEAARAETSILAALQDWLYRTPIQGSSPDDPGDDAAVAAFVEAWLDRHTAHHDGSEANLVEALGEDHRDDLAKRFAATRASARSFLTAADAPEDQRRRVRRIRAAMLFIESYRELPLLAWPRLLLDGVVELEQRWVLFRHRHARMVERIIGRRVGTGGSEGVDYLDRTTAYRVFKDLWAVRTVLLPRTAMPPLAHPERYGFVQD